MGRRSCTGIVHVKTFPVWFESALERDFLTLLDADDTVARVVHQPYVIRYSRRGRRYPYHPDFAVRRHDGSRTIYEVKYRDDLWEHWKELRPRLRAGVAFAAANGMRFKIVTDVEIRTPLLANVRFLARYASLSTGEDPVEEHLVATLELLGPATPATLLAAAYALLDNRVAAIPVLWRAIAAGRVGARITRPLTMASEIWVNEGRGTDWPGPHSLSFPLRDAWLRRLPPEPRRPSVDGGRR